ncbi:MAG: type II CRISPR-associated endonuclease Cas1 [Chlorobi bacterium]|nr:type II CRISPR-associated endonuclease Cas1 [Chlorobiota bacterium]
MLGGICYVGSAAYIHKHYGFLKIVYKNEKYPEEETVVPIDDVWLLIIDNSRISITVEALRAVLNNKGVVLLCDDKHLPHGLMYALNGYYHTTYVIRYQAQMHQKTKERIWKDIIKQKVLNQIMCLEIFNKPTARLKRLLKEKLSAQELEARAAKLYWQLLMHDMFPQFKRDPDGPFPNSLLNYTYAIVRAFITRSIVSAGLCPQLSIHHHRKDNPFVLADDLIEPFRPVVDLISLQTIKDLSLEELTKQAKKEVFKKLYSPVLINNHLAPIPQAIQLCVSSFAQLVTHKRKSLSLPEIPLKIFTES